MSKDAIPTHVGLILDGNRRWAKSQGLPTLKGHEVGYRNLKHIALHAFDQGVECVSAFVFSTENWDRTQEEIGYLMGLIPKMASYYLNDLQKNNIRLLVLGSRERVSPKVLKVLDRGVQQTAGNTRGTLCLCFNYGGQQEIADAVTKLLQSDPEVSSVITPEQLSQFMYGAAEVPPADFIVRTSGEQRLSGFQLWRAAYAELLFVDKHWPAFTTDDFDAALQEYARRHRRFGA
jgi:undecaprenyl diphosphate synthase